MVYFIWPWCLPGGYSTQAIKECIDYELKSADNPYVLTNFCKLLSLTYYSWKHFWLFKNISLLLRFDEIFFEIFILIKFKNLFSISTVFQKRFHPILQLVFIYCQTKVRTLNAFSLIWLPKESVFRSSNNWKPMVQVRH